ncbi:MAG: type I methionyl aminopeptidase [Chloroflexi bacterium]|nr:type I methionyl aminopeptidase [Chloroflexota bacterium]
MSIDSENDLVALKRIGKIVALALQAMSASVRPGMTTAQLDAIGGAVLRKHGAHSGPKLAYDFPGYTCISINDESAHGVPGGRVIRAGDLVNIDVSAELGGYYADTGATVAVLPVSPLKHKLCASTKAALDRAIKVAQAGKPINVIGQAIEAEAERAGFTIIENLSGHGVGRSVHEEPRGVLNYYDDRDDRILTKGLVVAVEPFLSTHADHVVTGGDGWTLKTPDGSLTAQYEHTIVVTNGRPIIITEI